MVDNWIGLPKDPTEHDRQAEAWFNQLVDDGVEEEEAQNVLIAANTAATSANTDAVDDLTDTQAGVVTYTSGWAHYDAGFADVVPFKTGGKVVFMEGLTRRTGNLPGGANHKILTLPVGFRPVSNHIYNVLHRDPVRATHYLARMDIKTNGDVTVQSQNGFTTWVSFSGISFRVA